MYVVVRCPRCGGLVLGKTTYRTRACSLCGHRITLRGMKVLGRADSPRDAVSLMQEMKKSDLEK